MTCTHVTYSHLCCIPIVSYVQSLCMLGFLSSHQVLVKINDNAVKQTVKTFTCDL